MYYNCQYIVGMNCIINTCIVWCYRLKPNHKAVLSTLLHHSVALTCMHTFPPLISHSLGTHSMYTMPRDMLRVLPLCFQALAMDMKFVTKTWIFNEYLPRTMLETGMWAVQVRDDNVACKYLTSHLLIRRHREY